MCVGFREQAALNRDMMRSSREQQRADALNPVKPYVSPSANAKQSGNRAAMTGSAQNSNPIATNQKKNLIGQ